MEVVADYIVNVPNIYALATLTGAVIQEFHSQPFSTFSGWPQFTDVISNTTQGPATSRLQAAFVDAFDQTSILQVPRIMASLPHDNSSVGIMQAAIGFTAITLMAVCFRIYSRVAVVGRDFRFRKSIRVEDWLILAASALLILLQALQCYLVTHGGEGKRAWDISYNESSMNLFLLLPTNVIFILTLLFTKLSIIFEYRNFTIAGLDRNRFFRFLCVLVGLFVVLGSIASIFGFIIKCSGFDYWSSPVQANCVQTRTRHLAISGFIVLTDVLLLLLPLSLLPSLTLRTRHKVILVLFFLFGLVPCIISAFRTLAVSKFYTSLNPFWDETSMHFLYLLESQFLIVCGCWPAIRALTHHRLRGTTDFNTRRGSVAYNLADLERTKSTRATVRSCSFGTSSDPNTPRFIDDEEMGLASRGSVAVAVKIADSHRHTIAFKKLPPVPMSDSPPDSPRLKRVHSMPAPVSKARIVAAGKTRSSLTVGHPVNSPSTSSSEFSFTGLSPTPPRSPGASPSSSRPRQSRKAAPPPVKIPTVPVVELILTPPPVNGMSPHSIHLGTIPPPLPPPTASLPELPPTDALPSPRAPTSSFSLKRRTTNPNSPIFPPTNKRGSASYATRSTRTNSPTSPTMNKRASGSYGTSPTNTNSPTSPAVNKRASGSYTTTTTTTTKSNRSSKRLSLPPAPQKAKAVPEPLNLQRLSALDVNLDSFPTTPPIAKRFQSPPNTPGTPGSPLIKLRLTPPVARSPLFPPSRSPTP